MPFKLIDTDCAPSFIDYEYEITNKDLLAEHVGEMLLGHHFHVLKIINSLSATLPIQPDKSIEKTIEKIYSADPEKRDGWFFQMISWIVLAKRNNGKIFYSNYPHFAPAQHGIDGLAITLNENGTLETVFITEDKCTTSPRGKITQQVFPEFTAFEEGEKNNALIGIISSLISHLDAGKILESIQNDIFNNDFRQYRIGITRTEEHNDKKGRKALFKNYEKIIVGDKPARRSGATIYIGDLRNWMADFADKVISYLEGKKSKNV
jgi:hypothetical protein